MTTCCMPTEICFFAGYLFISYTEGEILLFSVENTADDNQA